MTLYLRLVWSVLRSLSNCSVAIINKNALSTRKFFLHYPFFQDYEISSIHVEESRSGFVVLTGVASVALILILGVVFHKRKMAAISNIRSHEVTVQLHQGKGGLYIVHLSTLPYLVTFLFRSGQVTLKLSAIQFQGPARLELLTFVRDDIFKMKIICFLHGLT